MQTTTHRSLVEGFYQAWVRRDWDEVQRSLTPDFRFRSPVDDFIGIETYRTKCWPNGEGSRRFVVDQYMEQGDCAFLLYTWESDRGTIRAAEHITFSGGKIERYRLLLGIPPQVGKWNSMFRLRIFLALAIALSQVQPVLAAEKNREFPMAPGTCWFYKGTVSWDRNNKVATQTLTYKMTVIKIIQRKNFTAAVVTGFPGDLVWFSGQVPKRNRSLFARIPAWSLSFLMTLVPSARLSKLTFCSIPFA